MNNVEGKGSTRPWHPTRLETVMDDICSHHIVLEDDDSKGVCLVIHAQIQIFQVVAANNFDIHPTHVTMSRLSPGG